LDISGSEVSFHPAEFSSQFDMVLNRDFPEENAGQWSLINLDGIDSKKEFFFGSFQGRSQKGKAMEIQYKLTSRGHVLSSGTMNLEYTPIPDDFELSQAYPNPFNPTTTLSFAIPIDSEVSLSVYNLQGREVSTLIDANMDAGYHSIVWNADSYSSGVYFVKMVAGEYVNTQKLMLVK
jgi:hypothetical protein